MRVCAHVVFYQVSPNTFAGTNFKGTYLTPDGYAKGIAYTLKRKQNAHSPS